jgi:hypothetical protein
VHRLDATVFTLNYQVPAERWLSAFWRTPSDSKLTWATGIHSDFSRNVIIKNNVVRSPVGKKFRGIDGNAGGTIISSSNTFKNVGKNMVGDIIDRDAKR